MGSDRWGLKVCDNLSHQCSTRIVNDGTYIPPISMLMNVDNYFKRYFTSFPNYYNLNHVFLTPVIYPNECYHGLTNIYALPRIIRQENITHDIQ